MWPSQPAIPALQAPQGLSLVWFQRHQQPALFAMAMQVRTQVFVDEQRVPADHELDATDDEALHALIVAADGVPLATGRLFADATIQGAGRIGRMAVVKHARGTGVGRYLLAAMIDKAAELGFSQLVCDAQTHAMDYYARQGFVAEGDEFLDENIPHYFMRRKIGS